MNLKESMNLEYILKKYLDKIGITEDLVITCTKGSCWNISFDTDNYVDIEDYNELQEEYNDLKEEYEELESDYQDLEKKVEILESKIEDLKEKIEELQDD